MTNKTRLTKIDWLQAGFQALAAKGPQALKAEPLARALKVSKGSFYWHFKDIADYKSAMLDLWQQQATADIIADVSANSGVASERLKDLITQVSSMDMAPYGGTNIEAAIRDWARYDRLAQAALQAVDRQRLAYVRQLFQGCGFDKAQSQTKAALLYGALNGLQGLTYTGQVDLQRELRHLLGQLLKD